jgi:hypothetical protein
MQLEQGGRAPIAVVHKAPQAHFYMWPDGVAQPPRSRPGQFNRIAGSSRAMTPFNMLGVSYVFAIALLTIGAMAV